MQQSTREERNQAGERGIFHKGKNEIRALKLRIEMLLKDQQKVRKTPPRHFKEKHKILEVISDLRSFT